MLRTGSHVRYVTNRNDLVGRFSWIKGVKTGHTSGAGYVLVGLGVRHRMHLLSAVLGTASEAARDANTLALLEYGFDTFRLVAPVRQGELLARPTIKDRSGARADVIAQSTFKRVLPRRARVTVRLKVPSQLSGPLPWHSVVGTALVLADGRTIARIPLLLAHRLPAISPLTLAAHFITRTSTLLLLVVLLAATVLAARRRRLRMRHTGGEGAELA